MNLTISLAIKYAPDYEICHRHDHMLPQCPFKSIHPLWNISQGEINVRKKSEMAPIRILGLSLNIID